MASRIGTATLAILTMAGCDRVFGIGDPYQDARGSGIDADMDVGFLDARVDYRKAITIAQPSSGTLSSFPVSILLSSDGDLTAHVRDNTGKDIGFADAANNPLPCEIVRFDAGTGALDAWVLPPDLPAAPGTLTIDLVYGAPGTRCTASPWPANHIAVWHGELSSNVMKDHTTYAHDLTQQSTVPTVVDGIAGNALSFDGGSNGMCGAPGPSMQFGTNSFSYSVWFNDVAAINTFDTPLQCGGLSNNVPGFGVYLGTDEWDVFHNDNAHAAQLTTQLFSGPQLGRWINVVAVVDRASNLVRTYVDGVAGNTSAMTGYGNIDSSAFLCISGGGARFQGLVDEPRVYTGALSPEWVKAAYANIHDRTAMISIGAER